MAEDIVTLRIQLEGKGIKTMTDLEKSIKATREQWKQYAIGSKDATKAGADLKNLLETKAKVMATVETANGRMMKSYFQLGNQLRATRAAAMGFGNVITSIPHGMTSVLQNVDTLVFSLGALQKQAHSAGISMKAALISTLTGPAGITLAVSALIATMAFLPKLLEDTGKAAENAAEKLEKFREGIWGGKFKEEPLEVLKTLQETLKLELELAKSGKVSPMLRIPPGLDAEDTKKYLELISPEAERMARSEIVAAREKELRILKEVIAQKEAELEIESRLALLHGVTSTGFQRGGPEAMAPKESRAFSMSRMGRVGFPITPQKGVKVTTPGDIGQYAQLTIKDIGETYADMAASMVSATDSVASSIYNGVGKAWEDVFGKANSLLEQFISNFLSAMLSITARRAAFDLLSLIPGIGPWIGAAGGALGGLSSAGGGGGTAASANMAAGLSRIAHAMESRRFVVRGGDLVEVYESGRRNLGRKSF